MKRLYHREGDIIKILVISTNIRQETITLQPSRYIYEISRHLAVDNEVKVISDGFPNLPRNDRVGEIDIERLTTVNFPPLKGNLALDNKIAIEEPDVILWHIGMSSLYHIRFGNRISPPVMCLFTSPVYNLKDLGSSALAGLFKRPSTYGPIILGALAPRWLVKRFITYNKIRSFIVMNDKAANTLAQRGINPDMIHVVPNGLDEDWSRTVDYKRFRQKMPGITDRDFLALYLGSPETYRGIDTLIKAVMVARQKNQSLKLVVLSRRVGNRISRDEIELKQKIHKSGLEDAVFVITAFQSPEQIHQAIAAADVIVLPFKIVTSGVPLSILEAMALEKPVISTNVNAIPDILGEGRGYIVRPADPTSLTHALLKLSSDRELCVEMGRKAGEYVRTLPNWKAISRMVLKILENFI
jgi:phosphatidylinositol alpha-1,6-mannosyltransferase